MSFAAKFSNTTFLNVWTVPALSLTLRRSDPQTDCSECVDGLCLCLGDGDDAAAEEAEEFVVELDTEPPVIYLEVGDGQWAMTTSGAMVVVHTYPLFSPAFVDPGATAYDVVDGDVTDSVSSFGVGAVRMDVATDEANPYIITYRVSDNAGNAAKVRHRPSCKATLSRTIDDCKATLWGFYARTHECRLDAVAT